jgi:DMSO/TMAO reductase YedYZ heme-binding membrane subunit
MRGNGWPIVGWVAVALGGWVAAILLEYGTNEEGFQAAIYVTARTSGLLFLLPLLASPAHRVAKNRVTGWILKNRRYLGVSFAVSHAYHLLGVIGFIQTSTQSDPPGALLSGALTLAYAGIAAMVATSFDRTAGWLGPHRWRLLHVSGLYYVWVIFVVVFLSRAPDDSSSGLFAAILLGAGLFRLWALRGRSSRTA